jgi:hypothetical protein
MKRLTGILILALFVLLANAKCASASTYYVSVSSGSDSNSSSAAQSKNSPWAHLPGMANCTGNCASYTPQPGDSFILKGCDDWGNASFPIRWNWSGNSGSHITIGVDQSWYNTSSCSSWNRPKFDGGSAAIDAPECSGSNLNMFIYFNNAKYVDLNWIEEINYYYSNGTCYGGEMLNKMVGSDFITWTNFYIHKWNGASASAKYDLQGISCDTCVNSKVDRAVIDNSEGDKVTGANVSLPTTNSIFTEVSNALRTQTGGVYANNDIYHIVDGLSGNHPNCIETLGPSSGSTFYIYNNYIHDNAASGYGCNTAWGNPAETDYVWNNIFSNTLNTPSLPQANPAYALYMWNNTWAIGGSSCVIAWDGTAWTEAFVAQNNFCLTGTSPTGTSQSGGWIAVGTITGSKTITIDHNVTESQAQGNSQGFSISSAFAWQPTKPTCNGIAANCPIGAGTDLTSVATDLISSLGLDTTYACNEQTVNGVVQSVCPARSAIARPPGAWDAGAYQFSSAEASQPVAAPTGLSATVN